MKSYTILLKCIKRHCFRTTPRVNLFKCLNEIVFYRESCSEHPKYHLVAERSAPLAAVSSCLCVPPLFETPLEPCRGKAVRATHRKAKMCCNESIYKTLGRKCTRTNKYTTCNKQTRNNLFPSKII